VADVEDAGMDLLRRWSDPTRGYHDRTHLAEVLDRLSEIGGAGATAPTTRLAAWFHDAVYAARPGRDEQESADLARLQLAALGVGDDVADRVARLVLVTAHHRADDDQSRALCDADLAVLAAGPGRYAEYVAGVRREYAQVPDETFRARRSVVLADLLARQDLFSTEHGRRLWDEAARANVTAELGALRGT
jgi:predicted metal-dependent HD superfamily phosphohydrolase